MSVIKRTILNAIGSRFTNTGRIADVHEASANFRFIEIEAEAFLGMNLRPGDKVQINTGDWNMRTYTPFSLNPESGHLGILAFLHGKGPGSDWAATLKVGDTCQIFGPRQSLKIPESTDQFVLFGDETAIALATTMRRHMKYNRPSKLLFEATDPDEIDSITNDLGLTDVEIFAKNSTGGVSEDALKAVLNSVRGTTSQVILAGRAQSIQQLRSRLKDVGFPMSQVTAKVYWSDGKVGLD